MRRCLDGEKAVNFWPCTPPPVVVQPRPARRRRSGGTPADRSFGPGAGSLRDRQAPPRRLPGDPAGGAAAMVSIEQLEALDLLIWLQNGNTVADLLGTNQSTISRRTQRVLSLFEGRLQRRAQGLTVASPLASLLDLQRQIHQRYRLSQQSRLRLNAPPWSRPWLRSCLPAGWLLNPGQGVRACEDPLLLLRDHVIDACLVTPTQIEQSESADIVFHELYQSHIDLYGLAPRRAGDQRSPDLIDPPRILASSRLELLPFLPRSCRDSSRLRFEALRLEQGLEPDAPTTAAPDVAVAFLTPLMAARVGAARPLKLAMEWPYRESLAVLRSHAGEPAIQELLARARASLQRALAEHSRRTLGP